MADTPVLWRLALFEAVPTVDPPTEDDLRLAAATVSFGKHIGPLKRTPTDFPVGLH